MTIIKWLVNRKTKNKKLYFSRKLICVKGCFSVTCIIRLVDILEKSTKYIYSLKTFVLYEPDFVLGSLELPGNKLAINERKLLMMKFYKNKIWK